MKKRRGRQHHTLTACVALCGAFGASTWTLPLSSNASRKPTMTAKFSTSTSLSSSFSSSISYSVHPQHHFSRPAARDWIDRDDVLPPQGYGDRIGIGRVAQDMDSSGDENPRITALRPDDPRLIRTYAEFPLSSWDTLVDAGCHYTKNMEDGVKMVDIGSGLGRLVFYAALSRPSWSIHGIEISSVLHSKAVELADMAVERGIATRNDNANNSNNNHDDRMQLTSSSFALHLGSILLDPEDTSERISTISTVLSEADMIFAYSTAFPAKRFCPNVGALLLDPQWSHSLSKACQNGCVAITTDRALDPAFGWEFLERIDVENREVFGSMGYISVLRK